MTDPFAPEAAPRADGRRYPGAWPQASCVVTFDELLPLTEIPVGAEPVLAVGSNASPAQLRHKFLAEPGMLRLPMSRARVRGLFVGFTPWRAFYGAYPATPVLDPAAETELMVQWIEPAQLARIDQTETGYTRTRLTPADGVTVTVDGRTLDLVWAYVADSGPLTVDGHVVRMVTPWGDVEPGPWAAATQDQLDAILSGRS